MLASSPDIITLILPQLVSLQVAGDEASHFSLLNQRLQAVGSRYGALPAHDGCAHLSMGGAAYACSDVAQHTCFHLMCVRVDW